jgi:REP element-mobilizing transposase RayT
LNVPPRTGHRRSIRLPEYDYSTAGAYFVTICVQRAEMLLGEVRDGEMVLSEWGRLVDDFWMDVVGHFTGVAVDCRVTMPNHIHAVIVLVDDGRHPARWGGGISDGGVEGGETPPLRRNADAPRRGEVASPSIATHEPTATQGGETSGGGVKGGETPPLRGNADAPRRGEVASPSHDDSTRSFGVATLGHVVAYYKYRTTKRINFLRGMPGVRFWQRNYWEHVIRSEADLARIREYIAANPARWADDTLRPEAAAKWLNARANHHG